jgi:hypothetical protein
MAIDRFFTGFEGGETTHLSSADGNCVILDDGKARTGQFCLQCNVPITAANTARANAPVPTAGKAITTDYATAYSRIFFKLLAYPSASDVILFGYGTVNGVFQSTIRLDNTGRIAVGNGLTIGPYNSSPLPLNTWFRLELQQVIQPNGAGALEINANGDVFTESGTLIAAVSNFHYNIPLSTDVAPPIIGHADAIASTYMIQFDDWVSIIEDNGPASLPSATRITRVDATNIVSNTVGGSSFTNWSGDYRAITEIPFEPLDFMSSMDLDTLITFGHRSAAELNVVNAIAIKISYQLKASVAGSEWLNINAESIPVIVDTVFPAAPYTYYRWTPFTDADFTNFVFGIKNQRTELINLAQMYVEVLHEGGNYWPDELVRTGPWRHKIIPYLGTGNFMTIGGFGFKPQVVIIKKVNGDQNMGVFRISLMGGTRSKSNGSVTQIGRGILNLLPDGFDIGPSFEVNQAGDYYVAIGIEDGGYDANCYHLSIGAYIGNKASLALTPERSGAPSFVWVSAEQSFFRSGDVPGDNTTPLLAIDQTSNLIKSLDFNSITIGSDNKINEGSELYYYFSIVASGYLFGGIAFGNQTGAGNSMTISPFGFEPALVIAKAINLADAQWRYRGIHANADSNLWGSTALNATGITSLPTGDNGFTLGPSLSAAGVNSRYLAFADSFTVSQNGVLEVNAGIDQSVVFGTTVSLFGTGIEHSYPCAVMTFQWTQIAGPGTASFTTPNAPSTGVTFDKAGVYILRLTVGNGLRFASDDVQITVTCPAVASDAGPDQVINTKVTRLSGTTTGATGLVWEQIIGPGSVAFANANDPNTTVTFPLAGLYTLRLRAVNQCSTVVDDMYVTVLEDCVLPTPALDFNC